MKTFIARAWATKAMLDSQKDYESVVHRRMQNTVVHYARKLLGNWKPEVLKADFDEVRDLQNYIAGGAFVSLSEAKAIENVVRAVQKDYGIMDAAKELEVIVKAHSD